VRKGEQALAAPPSALVLAMVLMVFGYGQGLVMAPLSSAVLSTVKPSTAGAGSGMYGTMTQIGNAAGVTAIGAVFFAIEAGAIGAICGLRIVCAVDHHLRRIPVMDATRMRLNTP
jgi:predicted MFS family arabinose efflux permease